jgi:hypothetical protein
MSEKIISNEEIKLITGLTTPSAKLDFFNSMATKMLANILDIRRFDRHEIENEEVRVGDGSYIRLRSFPVDISTISLAQNPDHTEELTGYTFRTDPYDFRKFFALNEEGKQTNLLREYVYANYTAGFRLQGTVEVVNNDIAGLTLTITSLGVSTAYTFISSGSPTATQILIGANADETMANIAEKIGGIVQDDVVLMPLGMEAVSSDAVKIEIVNPDDMNEFKIAVAYMVAGAISDKSQVEGISSYRLGTKTVNFRDKSEANFTQEVIQKYLSKYKRVLIFSK